MAVPLPVAIIGAGPVGLAAAAHLVRRGIRPVVLEQGPAIGHAVRQWAHVRLFSPWSFNIDAAAAGLLAEAGWQPPPPGSLLPTGGEIVERYLEPLAKHPAIAPHIRLNARVETVTRKGFDKMHGPGREAAPFVLRWTASSGATGTLEACAVIDASGTWFHPNPAGIDGLPVPGERDAGDAVAYGIPKVSGSERARYAGRRTLVVGSGHSAINVVLDLLRLHEEMPSTCVFWAVRRERIARLGSGGDRLPARGALGAAAAAAVAEGRLTLLAPYAIERIGRAGPGPDPGLEIEGRLAGWPHRLRVGRLVVATGFRPDLAMLRELRVQIDPATEAPRALVPLIDPDPQSSGVVRPHGAAELAQPEPGLYIVGAKSYGRAPTFLMATGYEQVRSVAGVLAGERANGIAAATGPG